MQNQRHCPWHRERCHRGEDATISDTQQPAAIVTGASSGIGLAATQALLERNYRVVGNSRTISKSKDLKPSNNLVLVDGDID